MSHTLFNKMGKCDADLRQDNMVLSNYEGKTSNILGVIPVELSVGITTRSTFFMVMNSKANFNLLLGREWIHGIGAVPSTLYQRLIIQRKYEIIENIKVDQSYYKIDEAKGVKKSFHQHLENITPCDDESGSYTSVNIGRVLNLDPDHGCIWDVEEAMEPKVVNPPTGALQQMKMTTESESLARISAYLTKNKRKLALEAEKLQNLAIEVKVEECEDGQQGQTTNS